MADSSNEQDTPKGKAGATGFSLYEQDVADVEFIRNRMKLDTKSQAVRVAIREKKERLEAEAIPA